MKKLLSILVVLSLYTITACVKDDPYVEPPAPPVVESPLKDKLVLNEINGTGFPETDAAAIDAAKYIELYNNSTEEINLAGVTIYYNNVSSEPALSWTGTTQKIAPGAYLLLKGAKGIAFNTGLSSTQGIMLEMKDVDGKRIDFFQVDADANRKNTFARIPNGTGGWYFDDPAGTPGANNGNVTTGKTPIVVVPAVTVADFERSVALPTPDDDVVISATVTTETGSVLTSVVLQWTLNEVAQTDINMTKDGDKYSATITKQAKGAVVKYTLVAKNDKGGENIKTDSYTVTTGELATTGQVFINECNPNTKEWELYNNEDFDIDLTGWTLVKDNAVDAPFTFPEGAMIAAKSFKVMKQNEEGSPTFGMSATKGFKYDLSNAEGTLVDVLDNLGENQINKALDASATTTLGRITDGAAEVVTFSVGTIGQANEGGTILPTDYTKLVINEIDGNGKFIEIFNNGPVRISLTNVALFKNESTTSWWTGAEASIAPGARYTIAQSSVTTEGANEYTGNAGISAKQNLKFELKDPEGVLLDEFLRSNGGALGAACTPDYGAADNIFSFSRCPDGSGAFGLAAPSCGAANPASAAGDILVE